MLSLALWTLTLLFWFHIIEIFYCKYLRLYDVLCILLDFIINLCVFFLVFPFPQSSISPNIPAFCSRTKHDLSLHMAGSFGSTTRLLYRISVYPMILPFLGFSNSPPLFAYFIPCPKNIPIERSGNRCNLQPKHLGSGVREVFEPKRLGCSILRGLGHRRWWCRWGLTYTDRQFNGVVMVFSMSIIIFSLKKEVIEDLLFSVDLSCYIKSIPMKFMHLTWCVFHCLMWSDFEYWHSEIDIYSWNPPKRWPLRDGGVLPLVDTYGKFMEWTLRYILCSLHAAHCFSIWTVPFFVHSDYDHFCIYKFIMSFNFCQGWSGSRLVIQGRKLS